MVTETIWLPRSMCDAHCLDTAPRVGTAHAAARIVAGVAVVLLAVAALPFMLVAPMLLTRFFARTLLAALGVRHALHGRIPRRGALIVANHVSWLDVVVLFANTPAILLAKHEVGEWPVIGWLARAAGTIFVDRSRPRALPATVATVAGTLRGGRSVAVFPEGTTWCGRTGGPFRPAVFQAAIDAGAPVAPITLRFGLADGTGTTIAAYIGDDTLLSSLWRVANSRGLTVTAVAHPALYPVPGASRRVLARAARAVVQPEPGTRPVTRPVATLVA
jgi:1-acyl-sn-glycerol-3-phosphate acyltransferase